MTGASIITGGLVPGNGLAFVSHGWLSGASLEPPEPPTLPPMRVLEIRAVGEFAVDIVDDEEC